MTLATRFLDWIKDLFTEAEQEAIVFATPAIDYIEKNGGAPLRQFAADEVLAAEALVTDGPSKFLAAQTAIVAKLTAAEIAVVIGAVNVAIEMAHAKMVMDKAAEPLAAPPAEAAAAAAQ